MTMASSNNTFSIATISEDGEVMPNFEELAEILKKYPEKKVVFWSIFGCFFGQSFMLSQIHARLVMRDEENADNDGSDPVSDIFTWRNGIRSDGPHTRDIRTHAEPLWLDQDTMLFLLDTPGLDMQKWPASFLLCALANKLASIKLFNVNYSNFDDAQQLPDQLKFLQAIGFHLDQLAVHIQPKRKEQQFQQHLLVLVRDWHGRQHPFGFPGGKHFMDALLEKQPRIGHHLATVLGAHEFNSDQIRTFLMPSPGDELREAASCQHFNAMGGRLSGNFKEQLNILVKSLKNDQIQGVPCDLMADALMKMQANLQALGPQFRQHLGVLESAFKEGFEQRNDQHRKQMMMMLFSNAVSDNPNLPIFLRDAKIREYAGNSAIAVSALCIAMAPLGALSGGVGMPAVFGLGAAAIGGALGLLAWTNRERWIQHCCQHSTTTRGTGRPPANADGDDADEHHPCDENGAVNTDEDKENGRKKGKEEKEIMDDEVNERTE